MLRVGVEMVAVAAAAVVVVSDGLHVSYVLNLWLFQLLQFLCTGLFLLFGWTVFSFHASLVVLFCVVCLLFRFIVATVVFIVAHVCGSEISEFQ